MEIRRDELSCTDIEVPEALMRQGVGVAPSDVSRAPPPQPREARAPPTTSVLHGRKQLPAGFPHPKHPRRGRGLPGRPAHMLRLPQRGGRVGREGKGGAEVLGARVGRGVQHLVAGGLWEAGPPGEAAEVKGTKEGGEEADGASVGRERRSVVEFVLGVKDEGPFFLGRVLDGDPVVVQEDVGPGLCLGDEAESIVARPAAREYGEKQSQKLGGREEG